MNLKKELVKRWLYKAETDLKAAEILMQTKDAPNEIICFHAQQAVEKFLKAYLTFMGVKITKTHDLVALLEWCIELDEDFKLLDKDALAELTFYAVEIRYPDDFYIPSKEEAEKALETCRNVSAFIQTKLSTLLK